MRPQNEWYNGLSSSANPRTAIKAQVLVDFIAKFTIPEDEENQEEPTLWMIYADGSLVQKMEGVGIIILTSKGETLKYRVQLQFPATNNKAEYKTILMGLRVVKALRAKSALLKSDSKLVIGQIKGEFKAKERRM